MEIEQLKQKIVAETMTLMSLKVDNEEVVKQTFRTIWNHVGALLKTVPQEGELYSKAFDLVQAGLPNEYKQFDESTDYDEKGQALILLRHKAAEVCELISTI